MQPISEGIYELLMSRGIEAGRVGARTGSGERAGVSYSSDGPQLPSAREDWRTSWDIGMRKSPGTAGAGSEFIGLGEKPKEPTPIERRVLLKVVADNKCLPRETPMRGPRSSLGRHLVLVR